MNHFSASFSRRAVFELSRVPILFLNLFANSFLQFSNQLYRVIMMTIANNWPGTTLELADFPEGELDDLMKDMDDASSDLDDART